MSLSHQHAKIRGNVVLLETGSRPAQEDYVLEGSDRGIFAVADGFGGPVPGAAAAKAACEETRAFLVKEAGDQDATLPFVLRKYYSLAGNVLFNAVVHANRKVMALNRNKTVHEKGGASMVAGYLDGDLLALANVGSCSAWLIRRQRAVELVTPRTYGRLQDPFGSSFDTRSDDSGVPLMALGITEDLEPEIFEYKVRPGDWLLLHTDGLHPSVRDELVRVQSPQVRSEQASDYLRALLAQQKTPDNISLSLVIF